MSETDRVTETRNPRTEKIDRIDVEAALRLINEEDAQVPNAVGLCIPAIARFLAELIPRVKNGGRLVYIGTGTSGRLGVLDASEIPPTFGIPYGRVLGLIAGGYDALHKAVEASEDDHDAGAQALRDIGLTAEDTVVGIAASGRTPFTIGALSHANSVGCLTACITCVAESEITKEVNHTIVAEVGPEVIAGSTRMKSGTAQKLILNMISTMLMIRLGYVSGNLMTNVRPSNEKLRERTVGILMSEIGVEESLARSLLVEAGGDLKVAIVMAKTGVNIERAIAALVRTDHVIATAIESLENE